MKLRLSAWILALLLTLSMSLHAQDMMKGWGKFQLECDVARFYGDTNRVYVELYYGLRENALTYKLLSGQYAGTAEFSYAVRNDTGIVESKRWTVPHQLQDSALFYRPQVMTGLESFALRPGSYVISVVAYDANDSTRRDSIALGLPVAEYARGKESLSDVELCSSIQSSSDKQSLFYKNTLEVIPNPGRTFGTGLPVMYYYVEAYGLASVQSLGPLTVHAAVVNAAGAETITKDKSKQRLHDASVEIGMMNLSALHGGTYLFRVDLIDSLRNVVASASKKFFVYRPGAAPDTASIATSGLTASEYAFMSLADLDREFSYARYVASQGERDQYQALSDPKAKQLYLYEFWRRHGASGDGENDFKKEYFRRVGIANRDYATGTREGWQTDRGRVYVMYGPCDEVERSASSAESNPYETWHYNNLQGGVIFVFVDRNSLGDYILVHSTHRDELHDENWYQSYALKVR